MGRLKYIISFLAVLLAHQGVAKGAEEKCETAYGPKNAPVTVVAYTSATCHHCADFHVNVLPKIREKYISSGQLRLLVVPFAMDKQALDAYKMVYSMPEHKREMALLKVFSSQARWIGKKPEILGKILGLSEAECKVALNNDSVETSLLSQAFRAQKDFNVEAAPTFYMGGRKLEGAPTMAEFDIGMEEIARTKKAAS